MKTLKLLILGLAISLQCNAQITANYYGGCGQEWLTSVVNAPPYIYLGGFTNSFDWGGTDIYVVKLVRLPGMLCLRKNSGAILRFLLVKSRKEFTL